MQVSREDLLNIIATIISPGGWLQLVELIDIRRSL